MRIYVYQRDDGTYSAGFVEELCEAQGRIVESWPVDDEKQIKFLVSHGSNHGTVARKVVGLAEAAKKLFSDFESFDEPLLIDEAEWLYVKKMAFEKAKNDQKRQIDLINADRRREKARLEGEIESVMANRDEMLAQQASEYEVMLQRAKDEAWEQIIGVSLWERLKRALKLVFKRI